MRCSAFTSRDRDDAGRSRELSAELTEVETDLTLRRMLWESVVEWDEISPTWLRAAFDTLDVDGIQATVHKFIQTIYVLEKGERDAMKFHCCRCCSKLLP
jgi:hypothetical protein